MKIDQFILSKIPFDGRSVTLYRLSKKYNIAVVSIAESAIRLETKGLLNIQRETGKVSLTALGRAESSEFHFSSGEPKPWRSIPQEFCGNSIEINSPYIPNFTKI